MKFLNEAARSVKFYLQQKLAFPARDDLTRLYNARYGVELLTSKLTKARRRRKNVAVIFMDVDNFKAVNDRHGHLAGNHTLAHVGRVIQRHVRPGDTACRFGGDEFLVVLPGADAAEGAVIAERIRSELKKTLFSATIGFDMWLTASFGVAAFPEHGQNAERLIHCADAAMYAVKSSSKNGVRIAERACCGAAQLSKCA